MTYRYPITNHKPKQVDFRTGGYKTGEKENFVGQIQGLVASDLEERFARALDKREISYQFRARISSPNVGRQRLTSAQRNLPGEVEVDFLVDGRITQPVQIQGQIAHFQTKWQADIDNEKRRQINEFGKWYGWAELDDAHMIPYWELATQDQTDALVRRMF